MLATYLCAQCLQMTCEMPRGAVLAAPGVVPVEGYSLSDRYCARTVFSAW